MRLLAFDAATRTVAAAVADVADGETLLAADFADNGLTHSRTLLPMIDGVLRRAGLPLSQLDAIAVTVGPGSFTGVRIGLSTAKGLAVGSGLGVIGLSALQALAFNYADADPEMLLCPVFDARCGQVYNALFEARDSRLVRLCEDRALPIDRLSEQLTAFNRPVVLLGDGAQLCFERMAAVPGVRLAAPERRFICAVGLIAAAQGQQPMESERLEALYLRLSQAEREYQTKNAEESK